MTAEAILKNVGPGSVDVPVRIEAVVPEEDSKNHGLSHDFVPQELYDEVINKGYNSVSAMLADTFTNKVLKPLRLALEENNKLPTSPSIVASYVNAALKQTAFNLPLSNFELVEAAVIPDFDEVKMSYSRS